LTHNIDQPYISQLEQTNDKIRFQRIDADLTETFKEEVSQDDAKDLKKKEEKLSELFKKALSKEKLEVKLECLKNDKVSSMITLSEESRRMQDMMKMYSMNGMGDDMFGGGETLVLNANHPLVQYIMEHKKGETVNLICEQLYDLAMLSHKPLAADDMTRFVERSNAILMKMTK
jgi:molecular chaperone HtpG